MIDGIVERIAAAMANRYVDILKVYIRESQQAGDARVGEVRALQRKCRLYRRRLRSVKATEKTFTDLIGALRGSLALVDAENARLREQLRQAGAQFDRARAEIMELTDPCSSAIDAG